MWYLGSVIFALCGVLSKHTSILYTFTIYFVIVSSLITVMFYHIQVLKLLYSAGYYLYQHWIDYDVSHSKYLQQLATLINSLQSETIAFYTKTGKLSVLNKAVLYVRDNENCTNIRIIHIYTDNDQIPEKLVRNVAILDELYPKFKIDLYCVKSANGFEPDIVEYLSQQLQIPKNLMFITTPHKQFAHKISALGGVRVITY